MSFLKKIFRPFFSVEPFSEVPLEVKLLRLYVKQVYMYLGCAGTNGCPLKIAVFGAGRHSAWLFQITEAIEKKPLIVVILDDAYQEKEFHGYPVMKSSDFDPSSADLILISSDTAAGRMEEKCKELYGNKIRILNMYNELPSGPYYKEFEQLKTSSYVS